VISDSAWTDADLLKAVERLAAEPRVQEEWPRSIGTWPMLDELALDFEYEFDRVRHGSDDARPPGALNGLLNDPDDTRLTRQPQVRATLLPPHTVGCS
jgi:hypothetical protein